MAIYKTDLTQPLAVPSVDYSSAARAIEAGGKAKVAGITAVADIASKVYSNYREEDIKNTTYKGLNAEQTVASYFKSHQLAAEAQGKMLNTQRLAAEEQQRLAEIGMSDMYGYEADSEDFGAKSRAQLKTYENALVGLKKAAEGGMKNEEFVTRVATIAKNAIAKYPYMEDEIRKKIGDITGLVGADQFAIRKFVQDRFGGSGSAGGTGSKGVKSPEALLQDQDKFIADNSPFSQAQVNALRLENPPEYRRLLNDANNKRTAELAVTQQKTTIDQFRGRNEIKAIRDTNGYGTLVQTYATQLFTTDSVPTVLTTFKELATGIQTGKLDISARSLETEAKIFTNNMISHINTAKEKALADLNKVGDSYTKEDYDFFKAKIEQAAKDLTEQYSGKGSMIGMVAALAQKENASVEEITTQMKMYQDVFATEGNRPILAAIAMGGEAEKDIAKQYPNQYKIVKDHMERSRSLGGRLDSLKMGRGLVYIQQRVAQAMLGVVGDYTNYVNPYEVGDGFDAQFTSLEDAQQAVEEQRAGVEAVQLTAQQVLDNTLTLDSEKKIKNIIKVAINEQQATGVGAQRLALTFNKTKKQIAEKITGSNFTVLRDEVAETNIAVVERLADAKAMYERQFGARINFMVAPDKTLQAAMPTKPFMIRKNGSPTSPLTPEGMQYLRDMKAYKQFQQSYGNIMITAAYGPALVTDKSPFEHATQIANAINNNLPYEFMPQAGAGRGQAEGSPGITNYNYETGEVKPPSIYSGTQAEREAYDAQQRSRMAEGQAVLEAQDAAMKSVAEPSNQTLARRSSAAARKEIGASMPVTSKNDGASEVNALISQGKQAWSKVPYNDKRFDLYAMHLERQYDLPPNLLVAIKNAGERSNPDATSKAGAQGLMQFMPSTRKLENGLFQHDPFNPFESMEAAARYLQFTLENQYSGNVAAAIADYNGGPRQAELVLVGKDPTARETKNYLDRVLKSLQG
jgi:soluble lytic murein transglycosylase-like protein